MKRRGFLASLLALPLIRDLPGVKRFKFPVVPNISSKLTPEYNAAEVFLREWRDVSGNGHHLRANGDTEVPR